MTEIYIVKQIDNSRLRKELDYERTKECLLLMTLGVLCLLIFLLLAWQHFQIIRDGYENETLKKEFSQESEVHRQLMLERASLRSLQRIDHIAKTHLGLRPPSYNQLVVLPEPFPAEPSGTLLAEKGGDPVVDHSMARLHAIR
jgi:cell division protein FtsL